MISERGASTEDGGREVSVQPTIFISAYRNFSVRYILYSDIFAELSKHNYRIVVFVKDNDVEYYRDKLGSDNVIIEPVLFDRARARMRSNRFASWLNLARRGISGGAESYENSSSAILFDALSTQFRQTRKAKMVYRGLKLLVSVANRFAYVRKRLVTIESKMVPGTLYDRYYEKYRPKALVISSLGYVIDPLFMRASKRNGCMVISIIHSWDNTTTNGYRGGEPDHVMAWNDIMKTELNVFHDIQLEKIHVGGIAHWDFYFDGQFKQRSRDEFLLASGLSHDRKLIFYGTSSPIIFSRTFDVIEDLLKAMGDGAFHFPCQLVVRLHPVYLLPDKTTQGILLDRFQDRIEYLKETYGELICFQHPAVRVLNDDIDMPHSDMHQLAENLHHSDVLLTEYSTLMIEGAILGVPVVNVGLYNFRDTDKPVYYIENLAHLKRILETGATRNAHTMDQLIEYINSYLEDRSRDRDKRQLLTAQEVTTNPGRAGKSIADHIINLTERAASRI